MNQSSTNRDIFYQSLGFIVPAWRFFRSPLSFYQETEDSHNRGHLIGFFLWATIAAYYVGGVMTKRLEDVTGIESFNSIYNYVATPIVSELFGVILIYGMILLMWPSIKYWSRDTDDPQHGSKNYYTLIGLGGIHSFFAALFMAPFAIMMNFSDYPLEVYEIFNIGSKVGSIISIGILVIGYINLRRLNKTTSLLQYNLGWLLYIVWIVILAFIPSLFLVMAM